MADGVEFEMDTREISEALAGVEKNSKKDALEVVNQAGISACLGGGKRKDDTFFKGALHYTKTASKASIGKWDPEKETRGALTKKRARLFHAIANEGSKHGKAQRGQGNAALAKKIYNSRQRARGYAKGIWLKIGRDLGARVRNAAETGIATGKKATIRTLAAYIDIDKTEGWSDDMHKAYRKGLSNAARDMVRHIEKKLSARFKAVEPK